MTELVIGVKLKADGSGLVTELTRTNSAVAQTGTAAAQASVGVRELSQASNEAAASTRSAAAESSQAAVAMSALATETAQVANAVDRTAAAQVRGSKAANDNAQALRGQQFAIRNVGQQVGDFGLQVATGQDPVRAFGQQIGQLGYAMSDLGGRAGKVGAFLVGPWGIALTIASAVLAPFIEKLFETGAAADDLDKTLAAAAQSADSFGNAQILLGKIIDLSTDKLKTQNKVLIESIRNQAELALVLGQADEKKARDKIGAIGKPTLLDTLSDTGFQGPSYLSGSGAAGDNINRNLQQRAKENASIAALRDQILNGQINDPTQIRQRVDVLAQAGQLAGRSAEQVIELKNELFSLPKALNDQKAAREALDVLDGKPVPADLKPFQKDKAPRKPKSTAANDEFGRDTGDRIAGIIGQFDGTPRLIDQIDGKVRQLNDVIDDLGRKKPPNFEVLIKQAEQAKTIVAEGLIDNVTKAFEKPKTLGEQAKAAIAELDAEIVQLGKAQPPGFEKLIADAQRAKGVIEDSLNKPINDFLDAQNEQLRIGELLAQGRQSEADAQRVIVGFEKQKLELNQGQRQEIEATFVALRAQAKELEAVQKRQQNLLQLTSNVRGSITDALAGQSTDLGGAILDAFRRAFAEQITQRFVDPILNQINDKITGANTEQQAAEKFSGAVTTTISPLQSLADNADKAAAALNTVSAPAPVAGISGLAANDNPSPGEILVTATRSGSASSIKTVEDVAFAVSNASISSLKLLFEKPLTVDLTDKSVKSFSKGLDGISQGLSSALGKGFGGAETGLAVSGLAKSLGIKLDSTGSAIGGAIGSFVPIPGGDIIGSIIGGLIGGLFSPKAQAKSGAITSATGKVAISGTKQDQIDTVTQLVGSVQQGIQQISSALGAELGAFSVSISKREKVLAVDTTGAGRQTGPGVANFGTNDEAGAVAYAIANAIADGAIKGISANVATALQSSTDINKAVAEAVKVQDLEKLVGGFDLQVKTAFDALNKTAADRIDIAKRYGFDLLQVEKINADQRVQLLDATLKSRVGSLQDFLQSIKFGDLFEGSATDRRTAIQGEIVKAQKDAEAGVAGAADTLASLYDQLVKTSRDAFGTAGSEFSADRNAAITNVSRVVQIETDRINANAAAQAAQIDTLNNIAGQANESNDLLTNINSSLESINQRLASAGGGQSSGGSIDFIDLVARNKSYA